MKPLAVDLCCGLGGWSEGLLAEGWDVVGFDVERHEYGHHRYQAQLVLQDIRTLDGRQFRGRVSLIVASPPCQRYSYMAMPWRRAKDLAAWYRDSAHPERISELNELFEACLRIGKEAECATVIENVRGAQPWVGRARWNYGSYFLWGDVPALMPMVRKCVKVGGLDWNGFKNGDPNYKGQAFNTHAEHKQVDGIKNTGGSWFNVAHNTTSGKGRNPDGRNDPRDDVKMFGHINQRDGHPHTKRLTNPAEHIKCGGDWVDGSESSLMRRYGSKSSKRKFASAMIAKIPLPLARHIGRAWWPA